MPQLPLFVFGTLRQGESNHHYLVGRYDRVQAARLLGFARVAPLMIARQDGSVVDGELFDLTAETYAATLAACDELEELPPGELIGWEYRRIAVRVTTDSASVVAWAYVRPDVEPDADLNVAHAARVRFGPTKLFGFRLDDTEFQIATVRSETENVSLTQPQVLLPMTVHDKLLSANRNRLPTIGVPLQVSVSP